MKLSKRELEKATKTYEVDDNFVLEKEILLTCTLERLGRFYARNTDVQPLAAVCNPEIKGQRIHTYDELWLIAYYNDFRVHIIKHHRFRSGPHAARLYYQSRQNRIIYWIATLQIGDTDFYNQEKILSELTAAIKRQEFFISPRSQKDIVAL